MGKCEKVKMTQDEHEQFASDLKIITNKLESWLSRLYCAHSVNGPECKGLEKCIDILIHKVMLKMDNEWEREDFGGMSAYSYIFSDEDYKRKGEDKK